MQNRLFMYWVALEHIGQYLNVNTLTLINGICELPEKVGETHIKRKTGFSVLCFGSEIQHEIDSAQLQSKLLPLLYISFYISILKFCKDYRITLKYY